VFPPLYEIERRIKGVSACILLMRKTLKGSEYKRIPVFDIFVNINGWFYR